VAMFRQFVRILCVIGLVGLVGSAIVGQFLWVCISGPKHLFQIDAGGVLIEGLIGTPFQITYDWPPWSVNNLFTPPLFIVKRDFWGLLLPWWFIFPCYGLLAAILWRLTRRRTVAKAFPLEPPLKVE